MKLAHAALIAALLLSLANVGCSSDSSSATPADGGADGTAADAGDASSPPPIHAGDYDQHCAAATDCVMINEGDVCAGCGGCGNAAINKSDLAKYEADLAALVKQCPGGQPTPCSGSCILSELTCIANVCGVCHSPGCSSPDAGSDAASDASSD